MLPIKSVFFCIVRANILPEAAAENAEIFLGLVQ